MVSRRGHARRRLAHPFLLTCAAACAGPAVMTLSPPPPALSPADFPGRARLLDGFAPLADGAPQWLPGDAVLFGLRLRRGDDCRHWLLHLRLDEIDAVDDRGEPLPPVHWELLVDGAPQRFTSAQAHVTATVTDRDGNRLGSSTSAVPRDFLVRGFGPACRPVAAALGRHPGIAGSDAFYAAIETRPLAEAVVSAMAMLACVQRDAVLAEILWQVVQRPSWWSVVGNLGVSIVVRPRFHATVAAAAPVAGLPHEGLWRVPVELLVNDAPALDVELVVGTTRPPFVLGAGIVGAVARHPRDPSIEFSLLLLAARRGAPPLAGDQRSELRGRARALDSR